MVPAALTAAMAAAVEAEKQQRLRSEKLAAEVAQLKEELTRTREEDRKQSQTITLLAETIPISLNAMRTDIVKSVNAAVAAPAVKGKK